MKVWIATGKSRFEKSWKNQEVKWTTLVKKLGECQHTDETYEQYMRLSKDRQDQIKDVGGFVGGIINGGRRKKNSVSARYLITLDIDYAPFDIFADIALAYEHEFLIYSTHKHSDVTPRYRLVMPLAREVHADEYEAIARKVAGRIDIEFFDPTTFQPERLMYWPSASSDGKFAFHHQSGPWLDPDEVLAEYDDWRDVSAWPVGEKAKKRLKDSVDKQEDPESKSGVVGVFCRAYGIKSAIDKFLSDIYEPTSIEDRYTFLAGTTSAGMIVYDDQFSFSHHSTDPTCERLCNSFDLVRIHLFGDSDDRVEEGTPFVKRPSYVKMIELALADERVKQALTDEKVSDRGELLDKVFNKEREEKKDWAIDLEYDKKGKSILQTIANVVLILDNDPALKGTLAYDDLRKVEMVMKDLPWRKITTFSNMLTDADDAEIRNYLEILYGLTAKDKINDALQIVTRKNMFHPVRDYLKSLMWDRRERLEKLMIDKLGAENNAYVREVTKKMMVAAVARVFEPGIKFDNVPVLVGAQGIGKSMLISKLGGEWYSDTFGNLQNKDAMENLQGVWMMEIGELAGLKRHEVDTIKLFISKQSDRFRVAYGKRADKFPRQCIFIGTTNNDEFLQDQTGNRRFWPIRCYATNADEVRKMDQEEIGQVWAEACYYYAQGETLYLDDDMEAQAKIVQEEYTEKDDRSKMLEEYLDRLLPAKWYELGEWDRKSFLNGEEEQFGKGEITRDWVTVPEIWEELFKGQIKDLNAYQVKQIRAMMNKMPSWEGKMLNKKGVGPQRGWIRTNGTTVDRILG